MYTFHSLKVISVKNITLDAVTLTFKIPENKRDEFKFLPGQYITIKSNINGNEIRRSYSICSSSENESLTVGIKKVEHGLFSRYANDDIKENDLLQVHPPEGRFTFDPAKNTSDTIIAFAAGSGITPIMSIMDSVLNQTNKKFILVYGNKSLKETMFHQEITALIEKYPERVQAQFLYSRTQEDDAMFGRIERSTVNYILKNKLDNLSTSTFYLCGPEAMIKNVSAALEEHGVAKDHIKYELFRTTEETPEVSGNVPEGKTAVRVLVDDEEFTLVMDKKQRVLDAVLANNIDAPYSCQGGICSSCIARLKDGKVEMVKNQILTDSELEEGLILTCQAHPLTEKLDIDYDDV